MNDLRITTVRAIHDALALRGPDPAGGGYVRTSSPELYMDEARLRLARDVLRHLPARASASNVERLADELTEVVARSMKGKPAEAEPRATMFRS